MTVRLAMCMSAMVIVAAWATAAPKYVGIIAAEGEPMLFTTVTAEQWRQAFEQSDLVRRGGLKVDLLRNVEALSDALTTRAGEYFAIVNPNGEMFLCGGQDDTRAMNGRIREYLRHGGVWWETGGWPFCQGTWLQKDGTWGKAFIGGEGLAGLRIDATQWHDDAAAVAPEVTEAGRVWLGAERAESIAKQKVTAQRASRPDQASVILAKAGGDAYLAGYRVGYGWLFRVGGFNPEAAVILPAAVGACEHLRAMQVEAADVAPGSAGARERRPMLIGVIAPEPREGAPAAVSPDFVRLAFAETALARGAMVTVVPLRTPEELSRALTERAADYLAIINTMGEIFMVGGADDVKPMLARIKGYVEQGGIWWELAGVPFWYPCAPKRDGERIVGWDVTGYGAEGLGTFGLKAEITPDVGDGGAVRATQAGKAMLGAAWADTVGKERGWANRFPHPDAASLVLAEIDGRPYVVATRAGKGVLFHVGGISVSPGVLFPSMVETCRYLWGHAMPEPGKPGPMPVVAPAPAQLGINAMPDLEYAKVGGKSMMLDLYLPEKPAGRVPVIVWVHGGGWMAGDRKNPPGLEFVRRGYALASVEYRLSQEAKWPAQIYDLKGAIRWLRAHADQYGLDPAHFGAWGHSAGGHLVAVLGVTGGVKELEGDEGGNLDQSSAVQAVSDWAGPTDFLTLGPWHEGPESGTSLLIGVAVGKDHEKALAASPVTYVSKDAPPFLIVHGERDGLVIVGQAREFYEKLTKAGVPAELEIRPWTDHGISDPTVTSLQYEFFDRYLRARK